MRQLLVFIKQMSYLCTRNPIIRSANGCISIGKDTTKF